MTAPAIPAPSSLLVIMHPWYFDMFASTIPNHTHHQDMTILPTRPAQSALLQSIIVSLPVVGGEALDFRLHGYASLLLAQKPQRSPAEYEAQLALTPRAA